MKAMVLIGALCAASVLAAAPRVVVIKKKSGELLKGAIVSELESGYLVKLDKGGTVKVAFEEIADLSEPGAPAKAPGASPAPAASPAPTPPPPPPYAPPAKPAEAPGPCRPGESYAKLPRDEQVQGPLCVDTTEVTVAQYQACVDAAYCKAEGEMECGGAANWGRPDRKNHPMNCVSAIQAEVYCAWKQGRLPSADEYDALVNLGNGTYPWGDADPDDRVCWSGQDKRTGTCPAGAYPRGAGPAHLYDLVGNVWEWTSTEKRGNRVFVGGAWDEKKAKKFSTGGYNKNDPTSHFDDVGFRCVRAPN